MDGGVELRPEPARRPPLRARRGGGGGAARAGRAPAGRAAPELRRRAGEGRPAARCAATTPAAAARATWPRRPSACPARPSRTWPGSRTASRPPAASTARTSKRPRSGGRSSCARWAGPSPPKTTSSWPKRPPPKRPGSGPFRPPATRMPAGSGSSSCPAVADDEDGRLSFEQLVPPQETLTNIASFLDSRRTIGTRVMVEPPAYQGVTVVAMLRARPWADPGRLQRTATDALYAYLHPISGGMEGRGWEFGRPVHMGEIYALLQRLPGHRAGGGRPALRRQPDHRPARPGGPAGRGRAPTPWSSPISTRCGWRRCSRDLRGVRTPNPGGRPSGRRPRSVAA